MGGIDVSETFLVPFYSFLSLEVQIMLRFYFILFSLSPVDLDPVFPCYCDIRRWSRLTVWSYRGHFHHCLQGAKVSILFYCTCIYLLIKIGCMPYMHHSVSITVGTHRISFPYTILSKEGKQIEIQWVLRMHLLFLN